MSELILDRISKTYDGRMMAVDDVSLNIADGEFVTFLGPSGSGKTTTLMMIAGFEQASAGTISLDGQAIDPVPPHRRNIGMVFQNYALFPNMSVAANVGYPLRMRRVARAEIRDRVAKMLEIVGLSAFGAAEPRKLSGGQQQRVALARALVFEPKLLLLDEPLGALDKNLREHMQIEIRRIHRTLGVTTVYVTHDQTEAMTMSDRIAVFHSGRIEQVDAPLKIYQKPATRFVAGFVGDNNVFNARVDDPEKRIFRVEGLGKVAAQTSLSLSAEQQVVLAIRPEAIRVADETQLDNSFAMEVSGIVNYGDSALVMGRVEGVPLKVRVPASVVDKLQENDRLTVGWGARSVNVIPMEL